MLTVAEAAKRNCSTSVVEGLALQVIGVVNELDPGLLVPIASGRVLAKFPHVYLYQQRAARSSLLRVLAERPGHTLTVISGYRPLPAQILLHSWYAEGRCDVPLAAAPGRSQHEDGAALDVEDSAGWRHAFSLHGWHWQGPADPAHYGYRGPGYEPMVSATGIKAVQLLCNRKAGAGLTVDGILGPKTLAAIMAAPAGGWK